jgi:hypothetical protein
VFGFVGLLLLVGGGEYAKAPPGGGNAHPNAFGWWLRFLGGALLLGSVASVVRSLID